MANATPTRLGQNLATGDANALFLKIFSGEVLSAFGRENQMMNMTTVRNIQNGKSASFPVTGKITADYHVAGNEITGSTVKQTEKLINIDDMLISSTFVAEVIVVQAAPFVDCSHWYVNVPILVLASSGKPPVIELTILGGSAP